MKSIRWKYSKPSADVQDEALSIARQDSRLQKIVSDTTLSLKKNPPRQNCALCSSSLHSAQNIKHRDLLFRHCSNCGHVQSFNSVTEDYEKLVSESLGYEEIYPDLSVLEYESRCDRIYEPKKKWLFECLRAIEIDPIKLRWCDVGCGSGMFLKALQNAGVHELKGFDVNPHNLKIAEKFIGAGSIGRNQSGVENVFNIHDADIYTSFFVLEHVKEIHRTIDALSKKRSGTMLAFAVPVFGLITMFESIVESHYPRCLDAMLHTQIFTEESISFFLNESGYKILSEWHFGQDAVDFYRFISGNIENLYPDDFRDELLKKLRSLVDPIQNIVDRGHLSDSRHILAVKI